MAKRRCKRAATVALVGALAWVVSFTSQAYGQGAAATATLTGQVTDQTGAAMPVPPLPKLRSWTHATRRRKTPSFPKDRLFVQNDSTGVLIITGRVAELVKL